MDRGTMLRCLALAALPGLLACGRCSGSSGAPGPAPSASAEVVAAAEGPAGVAADVPEIRDTGAGRATAALRAVLSAYGIAFDAAAIERECKLDDEGASIDDLEDVAGKYGLDAAQVIVPAEHVLLPAAKTLPALVVVEGAEDDEDFVVAWRLDGDRVQVMSPIEGRSWVAGAELQKGLYVHEQTMPAADVRAAMASPPFREALRARMAGLGASQEAALALIDRAAQDPGFRGLAALDAAVRQAEADPAKGSGDAAARLGAAFDCAFEARCDGLTPVPASSFYAQPAPQGPDGEPQARVRGVLMLAIAGRKAPVASEGDGG